MPGPAAELPDAHAVALAPFHRRLRAAVHALRATVPAFCATGVLRAPPPPGLYMHGPHDNAYQPVPFPLPSAIPASLVDHISFSATAASAVTATAVFAAPAAPVVPTVTSTAAATAATATAATAATAAATSAQPAAAAAAAAGTPAAAPPRRIRRRSASSVCTVPASALAVSTAWSAAIAALVSRVARDDLAVRAPVRPALHSLALHISTGPSPPPVRRRARALLPRGTVATLLVQMPSKHRRAAVDVRLHGMRRRVALASRGRVDGADGGDGDLFADLPFVVFRPDCEVDTREIGRGVRTVLVYHIVLTDPPPRPPLHAGVDVRRTSVGLPYAPVNPCNIDKAAYDEIVAAADDWVKGDCHPHKIMVPLELQYEPGTLRPRSLQGSDGLLDRALRATGKFDVVLTVIERKDAARLKRCNVRYDYPRGVLPSDVLRCYSDPNFAAQTQLGFEMPIARDCKSTWKCLSFVSAPGSGINKRSMNVDSPLEMLDGTPLFTLKQYAVPDFAECTFPDDSVEVSHRYRRAVLVISPIQKRPTHVQFLDVVSNIQKLPESPTTCEPKDDQTWNAVRKALPYKGRFVKDHFLKIMRAVSLRNDKQASTDMLSLAVKNISKEWGPKDLGFRDEGFGTIGVKACILAATSTYEWNEISESILKAVGDFNSEEHRRVCVEITVELLSATSTKQIGQALLNEIVRHHLTEVPFEHHEKLVALLVMDECARHQAAIVEKLVNHGESYLYKSLFFATAATSEARPLAFAPVLHHEVASGLMNQLAAWRYGSKRWAALLEGLLKSDKRMVNNDYLSHTAEHLISHLSVSDDRWFKAADPWNEFYSNLPSLLRSDTARANEDNRHLRKLVAARVKHLEGRTERPPSCLTLTEFSYIGVPELGTFLSGDKETLEYGDFSSESAASSFWYDIQRSGDKEHFDREVVVSIRQNEKRGSSYFLEITKSRSVAGQIFKDGLEELKELREMYSWLPRGEGLKRPRLDSEPNAGPPTSRTKTQE